MVSAIKKLMLLAVAAAALYGCAAPPLPDLVWPEAPEVPRVKYVRAYASSSDLKKSSFATDVLLGGESGATSLKKPMGVHVSKEGKMFITDTAGNDILIFDIVNNTFTTMAGAGSNIFQKPIGVATDPNTGRIVVADSLTGQVAVLDKDYKLISYLTPGDKFKQASGVAIDPVNKKIYVTDTQNHRIQVFDLDTLKFIKFIGKRGQYEGEFNYPSFLAVDAKGRLYVTDTQNGRVQVFDSEGKVLMTFGQFGDAPGMFARPKGIAIDSEGHIYVVDAAFNNVQIFDDEGRVLMDFSAYGSDRGQLILPAGIAIDKDDYIYVVDQFNRRVEVFEYLGEKHKLREAKEGKAPVAKEQDKPKAQQDKPKEQQEKAK